MDFAVNLVNEVLSLVTHYEVSPHSWGAEPGLEGAGMTSLAGLYSLETFLSEGPISLGQSVATCPPSLSLAWGGGDQGPDMS